MKERNYGVDLLKIVSIFMVMAIHVIGQGGAITTVSPMTPQYNTVWVILAIFSCAVNCFAIVSGYVMYPLKFKLRRIINLWIQVFFYGLAGNFLFYVVFNHDVSLKEWISSLFPVVTNEYWYFTAYFGMFFFIPFMNRLISHLNKKEIIRLFVVILIIICGYSTLNNDVFYMNRGFSMLWLCFLYLFGAGIYKLDIKLTKKVKQCLYITLIISFFCQAFAKIAIPYITSYLFGEVKFSDVLNQYVSPFNTLIAISLLLLFSNFKFDNKSKTVKCISFISPLVFGCYLIQVQPIYYYDYLHNMFKFMAYLSPLMMVVLLLVFSLITFALYLVIDFVRLKVFMIIKVNQFSIWVERKIIAVYNTLYLYCKRLYYSMIDEG